MRMPCGRRPIGRVGVWLLAGLVAALAVAFTSPPLQAAPLDGAARTVMEGTTQQALEKNEDGQGINWSIPETGHSGTVIPTGTYRTSVGETCRAYRQIVSVGGQTWAANGTSCRTPGGGWRQVAYSGLSDIGGYRAPQRMAQPRTGYIPRHGYGPGYGYDYGYDDGYRPYYPRSGLGAFFGFGKGHSHDRHGHNRSKKHRYKKDHHHEKERHTSRKHHERKKHHEDKAYRAHGRHEGHSGQWRKSRDR